MGNQNQSRKNHVKHKNAEIVLAAVMAVIHVHFVQYALEAQVVSVISVNTAKMVQMDARNNARKAKRIPFAKPVLQIVLKIYQIRRNKKKHLNFLLYFNYNIDMN